MKLSQEEIHKLFTRIVSHPDCTLFQNFVYEHSHSLTNECNEGIFDMVAEAFILGYNTAMQGYTQEPALFKPIKE